ncbi:MAG: hypothetical protein WB646_15675, partial [Steroidobacteraceae bacterium]
KMSKHSRQLCSFVYLALAVAMSQSSAFAADFPVGSYVAHKGIMELPRFGGHVSVLVPDSVFPDFIDLTPQRGLPPVGGRSSGSRLRIADVPAHS